MKLLLDTHILLWAIFEPQKLPKPAYDAIMDTQNMVCISIVSLWEIAIKQSIGRITIPETFFSTVQNDSGFDLFLVQPAHIARYLKLPLNHRDPFDRMLIAQAQEEQLTLVTSDAVMAQYDVSLLKEQ